MRSNLAEIPFVCLTQSHSYIALVLLQIRREFKIQECPPVDIAECCCSSAFNFIHDMIYALSIQSRSAPDS